MTPTINPKAVFLDLDGTLADSLSVMKDSYRLFMKQLHREPSDDEFDSLNGPPIPIAIHQLKRVHALTESEAVLLKIFFDIIDSAYFSVAPCFGAIELLKKAKENHCTVGVVTSNSTKRTQAWLTSVGLDDRIDFIVSGDDVKHGKPHPEPYLMASKKTPYKLAEIVAIEDSLQGAQSATDAGLRTFLLMHETSLIWPKKIEPIPSLAQVINLLW